MDPSWQKYLDPRTLAKLQSLQLRARQIVEGYIAGRHHSTAKGFSIEFAEHREYSPGDDLRYVDWKVFGRTDKFYLKRFEDETNLACYLLLDVSRSLCFSSDPQGLSKLEYAKCVAAALAWLVLQQQDAVGLVTFDGELRHLLPASSAPAQLSTVLQVLKEVQPGDQTHVATVLHELAERKLRRGVVILLSDLFDDPSSVVLGLRHLRHRRHDVCVLHVLDRAELEFPVQGATRFCNLEGHREIVAEPQVVRDAYLNHFQSFCQQVRSGCLENQIDYHLAATDRPLDELLSGVLIR